MWYVVFLSIRYLLKWELICDVYLLKVNDRGS